MFPIEAEAVEVVAGTEYQCDIREAITDLGVVQASKSSPLQVCALRDRPHIYCYVYLM